MKFFIFILFSLFSFVQLQNKSKLDLLCIKWRMVGLKNFNEPHIPITDSVCTLTFKKDGTYKQESRMYNAEGKWEFLHDSTKLYLRIMYARGMHLPIRSIDKTILPDSIIKLTQDSLIYCSKDFNYQNKSYSYTNWYYSKY